MTLDRILPSRTPIAWTFQKMLPVTFRLRSMTIQLNKLNSGIFPQLKSVHCSRSKIQNVIMVIFISTPYIPYFSTLLCLSAVSKQEKVILITSKMRPVGCWSDDSLTMSLKTKWKEIPFQILKLLVIINKLQRMWMSFLSLSQFWSQSPSFKMSFDWDKRGCVQFNIL